MLWILLYFNVRCARFSIFTCEISLNNNDPVLNDRKYIPVTLHFYMYEKILDHNES